MQKITLFLAEVGGFEKLRVFARTPDPCVMTGRDPRGAQALHVFETDAELDLAVAENIGIRRSAGGVLAKKQFEHALPVLARKTNPMQRDVQDLAYASSILKVFGRRAVAVIV